MKGMLRAHDTFDRTIHLVDSFDGLPKASTPEDVDMWSEMDYLKVPLVRNSPASESRLDAFPVARSLAKIPALTVIISQGAFVEDPSPGIWYSVQK